MTRVITAEQIDAALDWAPLVTALEAGHRLPRAHVGDLHLSMNAGAMNAGPMKSGALLNRAAWIPGLGSGLKTVSIMPGNPGRTPPLPSVQGLMVVYDEETGTPRAAIDGVSLTRWKTVADSLLGARFLARPEAKRLLIVGAGTIAGTLARAYPALFPALERIEIWNRSPDKAEELAAQVGATVARDLAQAVAGADIVTCATMAREPVIRGAWLTPGTHLDLIGAFNKEMREADDEAMTRGRLFVDNRATTIGEIGELIAPLRSGAITEADVLADHYDLCQGARGRRSPEDITVFKNGGGAHLDLMTALHVLEQVH